MSFDPLTAVADAFSNAEEIALPLVLDYLQRKDEEAHEARIKEWNDIQQIQDPKDRANREYDYFIRLFSSAKKTIGDLGRGSKVAVTTDFLAYCVELISEGIKKDNLINILQRK